MHLAGTCNTFYFDRVLNFNNKINREQLWLINNNEYPLQHPIVKQELLLR